MPLPGVPHIFKDRFWQCGCKKRGCVHAQDHERWEAENLAQQRLVCRDDCPHCWPDRQE